LGRTHHRFRTPANATVTIAVLGTALAAIVGFALGAGALGGAATTVYYFFATLGTLAVIIVYIGLCVGGMVFFRRIRDRYSVVTHLLIPAAGVVLFGAALFGSVYPAPPAPLNLTPYLTVAVVLAGLVVVVFLRVRRPGAVQRIGSILGEEGREMAGDLAEISPSDRRSASASSA
jgi:amino acid transporter